MLIAARNAMMVGGKLSAKSYMQDSAVLFLDGIENVAFGAAHSTDLEWYDLINGYKFRRVYGTWAWTDNALTSTLTDDFKSTASIDFGLSNTYTLEVVSLYTAIDRNREKLIYGASLGGSGIFINGSGFGFFYTFGTACATGNDDINLWGCPWTNNFLEAAHHLAVSVDNGHGKWYINGGGDGKVYESDITGTTSGAAVRNISPRYGAKASYSRIMIHSRALTADEIAANYAIDKARFNLS